MKLTAPLLATLGVAACVTVAAADLKTTAPAKVNLTGVWKINDALSDDPQQAVSKKKTESSSGGPIRGSGGGTRGGVVIDTGDIFGGGGVGGTIGRGGVVLGRGGGGGGGDRPDGDPEPGSMKVPLDSFLATRDQLDINQQPDGITISSLDDSSACKAGVVGKAPTPNGEMVDLRCGWDGSTWITELKEPEGVTRTNRYELRKGGKQLVMISEVKGGHTQMSGLKIKRVYDKVELGS